MHTVIIALAVIAIVVYVIGRQLLGEPLRGKRVIALPAILALVGVVELGRDGRHPDATDIVLIAISGVIAVVIGLGQGRMMRLESRAGALWGQMPVKSLWLWAALVVSRVVMTLIAHGVDAHVAASSAPIFLLLGLNRLGQAAVVAPRAFAARIPFAPEKDGSTFLGGAYGSARNGGSAPGYPTDPVPPRWESPRPAPAWESARPAPLVSRRRDDRRERHQDRRSRRRR